MVLDIDFRVYTILLFVPYLLIAAGIMPPDNNLILYCSFAVFFASSLYIFGKGIRKKGLCIDRTKVIEHMLFTIMILLIICVDLLNNHYTVLEIAYNAEALVVIINSFLIYVVFYNAAISEKNLLKMLRCIIYIAILSCAINIALNLKGILSVSLTTGVYEVSFSGPFINRNAFGIYMVFAMIALVYYLRMNNLKGGKYGYLMLLFAVNLVLSFSRGALLFAGAFFLLCFMKDNLKRRLPFIIIAAFVVILLVNNAYVRQMVDRFLIRKEQGSSGRFASWGVMLAAALDNPLTLLGISASGFKRLIFNGLQTLQVDNAYIETLFTYGIGGLVLYFWALYSTIKSAALGLRIHGQRDVSLSIIFATIAFMLHNNFEALLVFEVGFLQWIGLFLIIVFPRSMHLNNLRSLSTSGDS